MSYRAPQALGQTFRCPPGATMQQCVSMTPGGGGQITPQVVAMGVGLVALLGASIWWWEMKRRLLNEAFSDEDDRLAAGLVVGA
jgi:hypothetical protein